MLSAREFMLELEVLQATATKPRVPKGSVMKRQLCWTDATTGQYFALTKYTDAVDDGELDGENCWTLDKPGGADLPKCLIKEVNATEFAEDGKKRGLKVHSTLDACQLAEMNAVKRRRVYE
jgi:hypothetical protein